MRHFCNNFATHSACVRETDPDKLRVAQPFTHSSIVHIDTSVDKVCFFLFSYINQCSFFLAISLRQYIFVNTNQQIPTTRIGQWTAQVKSILVSPRATPREETYKEARPARQAISTAPARQLRQHWGRGGQVLIHSLWLRGHVEERTSCENLRLSESSHDQERGDLQAEQPSLSWAQGTVPVDFREALLP